ncbi:class I SAM-dependent methyltransferase [Shewanella kaireitica]|uniref:class I SAM-dependent methyltransferase n=1 Tax=Shewanella kaireitica TaxID=212021 RepID=UPI00200BCDA5|nr:class I SAM-dependent methyltransferase [Shewanella kaireitica]
MVQCPLCGCTHSELFDRDKARYYRRCQTCQLVFVPPKFHLSVADEKAIYNFHQNSAADKGYRQFLSRALVPLFSRLASQAQGLDFGCGPGPAISVIAAESGIQISNYDPYYYNDMALLQQQYDFVTTTEVIEHVADALMLLQKLDNLLKPGATLVVMTKRVIDKAAFTQWHYKRDLTHICFYSIETFKWIADNYNWTLEIIDTDVVFFTKRI